MSTAPVPGRRVDTRANLGRTALFGVVVVGLTLGMLTLAGTTPRGIGRPVEDPSRVRLDQRTFSCAGAIPGATIRSGNLDQGLARAGQTRVPADVVVDQELAARSFAGLQAKSAGSLAWVPCPEPQARWWFVGAGGAAVTHNTVFTISNPRTGTASVDIDVYGPDGLVASPDFRNVPVPSKGRAVIDLARTAPANQNLAVSIVAKRGLVAVTAVDRFAPGSVGRSTREWLPPQSLPATSVTLAGLPSDKQGSTLVVANPNPVDAVVKVQLIGTTGTFSPAGLTEFIVGPASVLSTRLDGVLDGTPVAMKVTSDRKVTATVRSVKDGDTSFATGVRVLRGGTSFAVPDGSGRLVLSSLRSGGAVRYIAYTASGRATVDKRVTVKAQTSLGVKLPGGTKYVHLYAFEPDLVAGFTVRSGTGTTSAGVSSAIRSVRLPKVRPGW